MRKPLSLCSRRAGSLTKTGKTRGSDQPTNHTLSQVRMSYPHFQGSVRPVGCNPRPHHFAPFAAVRGRKSSAAAARGSCGIPRQLKPSISRPASPRRITPAHACMLRLCPKSSLIFFQGRCTRAGHCISVLRTRRRDSARGDGDRQGSHCLQNNIDLSAPGPPTTTPITSPTSSRSSRPETRRAGCQTSDRHRRRLRQRLRAGLHSTRTHRAHPHSRTRSAGQFGTTTSLFFRRV